MGMRDAEVYEQVRTDLIRYASVLVGPDSTADVVSTVVVKVLARRSLADLEEPRPYLFRAVLNEARGLSRRRVAYPLLGRDESSEEPNLYPEVMEAVSGLPVQQRAATYLVYWLACSIGDAAGLMNVSDGTVKRYLFLARRSLRRVLHAGV